MFQPRNLLYHRLSAAPSEDENIEKGVATQSVRAMNRDTGAFAGCVKSRNNRTLFVREDSSLRVCGDAAHDVMAGGLNRNRVLNRINAKVDPHKGSDLPEFLIDLLFTQ